MTSIWILDRDEAQRAALARLAGVGDAARIGSPADASFETATGARAVVLGLGRNIELELEFAHRTADRLGGCTWILIARHHDPAALHQLFDAVEARVLRAPLSAETLRAALRQALAPREGLDPLSLRRTRDALSERFARWFADLDLPELLRAMDPQLARVPLVVRGEPGTGRRLLARYIHTFGGDAAGGGVPFIEIDCARASRTEDLLAPLRSAAHARTATVVLCDLDRLAAGLEPTVRSWIEYGLPPEASPAPSLRWIATLSDSQTRPLLLGTERGGAADVDADDNDLAAALAGVPIRIPPLRERRGAIPALARATVHGWCERHGQRPRALEAEAELALVRYDWPANLRELEAVLARALASHGSDPLRAAQLRLAAGPYGEPAAPVLLMDEDETGLPEARLDAPDSTLASDAAPTRAPQATPLDANEQLLAELEASAQEAREEDPIVELSIEDLLGDDDAQPASPDAARGPSRLQDATRDPAEPKLAKLSDLRAFPDLDELAEQQAHGEASAELSDDPFATEHRAAIGALPAFESFEPLESDRALESDHAPDSDRVPESGYGEGRLRTPAEIEAAERARDSAGADGGDVTLPELADRERSWHRLIDSVADQLRTPLVSIRTFAELLDDHYGDPEFRSRFGELVGADLRRLEDVAGRLEALGIAAEAHSEPVDVTELVETLLMERREAITRRQLLVLKELDRRQPLAFASPLQLRFVLDGLIAMMLEQVPNGGDVYIASHHSAEGLAGKPAVRVLLRYQKPVGRAFDGRTPSESTGTLALSIAEAAVRGLGGRFASSETATETVVVLDLPAPL